MYSLALFLLHLQDEKMTANSAFPTTMRLTPNMDAQQLTCLFVFLSFSLYIGIAIWSRADPPMNFMSLGAAFAMLTAWLQQRIG